MRAGLTEVLSLLCRHAVAASAAAAPRPKAAAAAAAALLVGLALVMWYQRSHVRLWGEGSIGVRRGHPGEA